MDALLRHARSPSFLLQELSSELVSVSLAHWREVAPWAALCVGLHVLFERLVPAALPGAYDVFNAGAAASGKAPRSRAALARDVRTRAVASLFSLYVVGAALRGVAGGDYSALQGGGSGGSTPLTEHLVRVACGFFLWDAWVSWADGFGAAYVFHGLACLAVFGLALRPAMHSMALVALGFEASTPLLHARLLLIAAGRARGRLFAATVYGFAATFFVARIAIGYWASYHWAADMLAELAAPPTPRGARPAVILAYMALNVALNALNGYWFLQIAAVALGGSGGKAVRTQRSEPQAKEA